MWGRRKNNQPYPKKRKINIGNIHGKKGMFKDPQYVSLLRRQNLHELDLAGASRAGGKATIMTSRQLNITPRQVRGQLSRSRTKSHLQNNSEWRKRVGKELKGDSLKLHKEQHGRAVNELKRMGETRFIQHSSANDFPLSEEESWEAEY